MHDQELFVVCENPYIREKITHIGEKTRRLDFDKKTGNSRGSDTIGVEIQSPTTPVRLVEVDTLETVAPGQPVGCLGKEDKEYTKRVLADQLVSLEIPRIGDSEGAYGRRLACVYLDTTKMAPTSTSSTRT
jgi:endonuclease YncB( thermonuclease family)